MGGPSGQKNKSHKAGRRAGLSARERARRGKEVAAAPRANPRASTHDGKLQRHLAARQSREAKRQELLEKKRRVAAPVVVGVLPLSEEVDVSRFWHGLRHACEHGNLGAAASAAGTSAADDAAAAVGAAAEADMELDLLMSAGPLQPTTVHVATRGRVRLTLLPPPAVRNDPLAIADLGRCVEVLLLLLPGGSATAATGSGSNNASSEVDAAGQSALAVLRAMGMPSVVCCVVGAGGAAAGSSSGGAAAAASMKDRSAARKRAEKALASHLAGEHRVLHGDTATDLAALARHLAEHPPAAPPLWRKQRPAVMVERVEYELSPEQQPAAEAGPSSSATAGDSGTLVVYGYVRSAGLSANQLVTIPGAGDFRILSIHAPTDPNAIGSGRAAAGAGTGGMEVEETAAAAAALGPMLAKCDPEEADQLVRENVPEPGEEEQTWPTEEEMAAATAPRTRRRKVPEGTSEYQAAWILDDEDYGDEDEDEEDEDEEDGDPFGGMMEEDGGEQQEGGHGKSGKGGRTRRGGGGSGMEADDDGDAPELQPIDDEDEEDEDGEEGAGYAAMEEEEGGDGAYAAA
ncbi:hypothetical protein Agub_g10580, partial [Astrephomene gubernaculifera]